MRLPGRRGPTAAQWPVQIPPVVVCPVCHQRNEVTARFCRDCGLPLGAPRDPVRGTVNRRADLPSDQGAGIAAVLSLLAIVVIAGVAGFLVFQGFGPNGRTTAGASASPVAPVTSPTRRPAPTRVVVPDETTGPAFTAPPDDPTEPPTEPTDEPEPTTLPTRTAWTCDDDEASIQDPVADRWRITQARWSRNSAFDRLIIDLTRVDGEAQRGGIVTLAFERPGRAASLYGVERPQADRALVVTFDRPISLRSGMTAEPDLEAVSSVEGVTSEDRFAHLVIGVVGDGCARLVARDWDAASPDLETAELLIDIQRER